MRFREWLSLQEVGTGTNAIAVFARPIMGDPVRRCDAEDLMLGGKPKKHKKRKVDDEDLPGLAD